MVGTVIALLLFSAIRLADGPHRKLLFQSERTPPAAQRRTVSRGQGKKIDPHELPLFVHQLAGLLQAGRAPLHLWEDILEVHRGQPESAFSRAAEPVLQSARQAAGLGLSVPEVLREVAARSPGSPLRQLWRDLASCIEVSENSGAPLAAVLGRFANQLEAQLDADAARDTALAGPKATVRLLSWLPLFGFGLGFLIGVNPLSVLLGSVPGMAALLAGAVLMAIGRLWSAKLVRDAEGGPV